MKIREIKKEDKGGMVLAMWNEWVREERERNVEISLGQAWF